MTMLNSALRAALLGGICLFGAAARAEVPANGSAYIDASVAAVESLASVEPGKARLPRLSDPVEGKVLRDVWNDAAILGKGPYTADDIPALLNIVQKQTRILQAYTLFSPNPGKVQPDTARNVVEYQDELSRSHAFLLKAIAASLQAINDFGAHLAKDEKTDERFAGLRQMRLGLQQIITGVALALRNPALREANQTLIASSLAENAAGLVAGIGQADRTALIAALQATRPALKPAADKSVAAFIATAGSAACEGLCLLQ